jgi:hypothetical protein
VRIMYFSEKNMREAWLRAQGKCEGTVVSDGRKVLCGKPLEWENLCFGIGTNCKGINAGNCWTVKPRLLIKGTPLDVPSNCQILCHECHRSAQSPTLAL